MIRPTLNWSPILVSSMVPLGFSVGTPGEWASKTDSTICGRAPMARLMLTWTSPRLVVHEGDVAVGMVEDHLAPLDLVAQLADLRGEQILLAWA